MSTLPHPIPPALAELIAERLRALADPTRILLLDRLCESAATVSELTQGVSSSQQNVSKHLAILYRAGLLERSKDGASVRYALSDTGAMALCEQACGGVRNRLSALGSLFEPSETASMSTSPMAPSPVRMPAPSPLERVGPGGVRR